MAKKALPKKLSTLIRLAVQDVKQVAKNRKYILNLSVWHEPITNPDDDFESHLLRIREKALAKVSPKAKLAPGKCMVCFAGSTIANRMGCSIDQIVDADYFGENNSLALHALNEIREGSLFYACNLMIQRTDISERTKQKYRDIAERVGRTQKFLYKDFDLMDVSTRKKFYKDMETTAKFFEEHGV